MYWKWVRVCYLIERAVTVGQIQSLQTVWVTKEAVQVLYKKTTNPCHNVHSNAPPLCCSTGSSRQSFTGRSSPLSEFPDRSRCVSAEETAGLAYRAWQRLFTPGIYTNAHMNKGTRCDEKLWRYELMQDMVWVTRWQPLGDMDVLQRLSCLRPIGSLAIWALSAYTPKVKYTHRHRHRDTHR